MKTVRTSGKMTGTFEARWYEDGTTTGQADVFVVDDQLASDIVIGGHLYDDIMRGRTETI